MLHSAPLSTEYGASCQVTTTDPSLSHSLSTQKEGGFEPSPGSLTIFLVTETPGHQLESPSNSEQGSSVCSALREGLIHAGSFKHHSQGFLEQGMPEMPDLSLNNKTCPASSLALYRLLLRYSKLSSKIPGHHV